MSERDLFGGPVPVEPEYQQAVSGPADRMFDFPVTLPGQMALETPEGASDATSDDLRFYMDSLHAR